MHAWSYTHLRILAIVLHTACMHVATAIIASYGVAAILLCCKVESLITYLNAGHAYMCI